MHPSLHEADVQILTRIACATWQDLIAPSFIALTLSTLPVHSQPAEPPTAKAGSAPSSPAPAAPAPQSPAAVTVRAGDHGNYTRVVFVLPPGISYRSTNIGDLLVLTFPGAGQVAGMKRVPARILSISGGDNQAAIGLDAGMHGHVWRIGDRVIVDISSDDEDKTPLLPAAPPAPPSLTPAPDKSAPHQ
jgi:hypothetical protein